MVDGKPSSGNNAVHMNMEVGGINDFCPAFVYSNVLINSLTVRAVAVAAGIIVELHMPSVRALGNIYSEFLGFIVQNRLGNFVLGF